MSIFDLRHPKTDTLIPKPTKDDHKQEIYSLCDLLLYKQPSNMKNSVPPHRIRVSPSGRFKISRTM